MRLNKSTMDSKDAMMAARQHEFNQQEWNRQQYKAALTATPKRMTIKSTAGPNQGKTFLAIYEIKNANAMRVCYDLSGKEFPKEFKAPKDSDSYLVGYRRQLPAADDAKVKPAATPGTP